MEDVDPKLLEALTVAKQGDPTKLMEWWQPEPPAFGMFVCMRVQTGTLRGGMQRSRGDYIGMVVEVHKADLPRGFEKYERMAEWVSRPEFPEWADALQCAGLVFPKWTGRASSGDYVEKCHERWRQKVQRWLARWVDWLVKNKHLTVSGAVRHVANCCELRPEQVRTSYHRFRP
jgi:hypothetical protein